MNPTRSGAPKSRVLGRSLLSLALIAGCAWAPSLAQPWPLYRAFSVHDLNRDGFLDPHEYGALLELRRGYRPPMHGTAPPPAPAFEEMDRDRDGLIGEGELTDTLQRGLHRHRWRGPRWRYPAQVR